MRYATLIVFMMTVILCACDEQQQSGPANPGPGPAAPAGLTVDTSSLSSTGWNSNYYQVLAASGGQTPYRWSLATGALPGHMDLTLPGEVCGNTGSAQGTFAFRVKVTDALGATAERDLSLTVAAPPPPTGGPVYYAEPVIAKFVFTLDCGTEMAATDPGTTSSRLARSQAEALVKLSQRLDFADYIDVIAAGQGAVTRCFGAPQMLTPLTRPMAEQFIQTLIAAGSAPLYSAIREAFQNNPSTIVHADFWLGSTPGADAGAPGGVASYSNMLADSPAWVAQQQSVLAIYRNTRPNVSGPWTTFLTQMAASHGGMYLVTP